MNGLMCCIPLIGVRSKHALSNFSGLQMASIVFHRFTPIQSHVLVALEL